MAVSMLRALAPLLLGVGLALFSSCTHAPVEPLEPITADDIQLPPRKPPPGQIVDIPLDREPDPDGTVPDPPEEVIAPSNWTIEAGFDRPRGDYRVLGEEGFALRHCKEACAEDPQCVAFTYSGSSGPSDPRPVLCKLKYRLTEPVACGRCTSGVKP